MSRIRNLTLFAVGWGLLCLSTMVCSIPVDAAIDGVPGKPVTDSASATPADSSAVLAAPMMPGDVSKDAAQRSTSDLDILVCLLWPLGMIELWLVVWMSVWSVALLVSRRFLFDIDVSMRGVRLGRLPFSGGVPFTLAHLTLVRAFAQHPWVADEWLGRHSDAINDWLSIEVRDSEPHERELLVRVDGQAIAVADASTLQAMLPQTPFVLAMHGDGRRWNDLVLNIVLRQAMHPARAKRMMPHRAIPVVLDRNCVERLQSSGNATDSMPLWLQVIRSELCRIPGIASNLSDHLLKCLVQSRRILPIVDQWSRTPLSFQHALQTAVSTGELPCLVVFDDDDTVAEMQGVIRARSLGSPEIVSRVSKSVSQSNPQSEADFDRVMSPAAASSARVFDASAVPLLIRSLEDSVADVRLAAAHALGRLGSAAGDSVKELTALLSDPVTGCRQAAANALGAIGPAASDATAALAQTATKDHRMVRAAACRALGAIGWSETGVLSALAGALKDNDAAVRLQAARSLGGFGVAQPEMVSALNDALTDESADVRCRVVAALAEIPGALNESLAGVVAAVADPAAEVRREAVAALGKVKRARNIVVPALTHSLSDPDAQTRTRAAVSLSRFGQESRSAIPQLTRLVHDSVAEVRTAAVVALDSIGVPDLASVSAIEEATRDADDAVRSAAQAAFERIMRSKAA